MLQRDSAHIHEQDTKTENRRRLRQGKPPVEPLYTIADAERALEKLVLHPFGEPVLEFRTRPRETERKRAFGETRPPPATSSGRPR